MAHNVLSTRLYAIILVALLALTGLTAFFATVDLGGGRSNAANVLVALAIAVSKTLLVVLFFMHLRYGNKLTWLIVGGVLLWALIAGGLTMADYLSRPWFPVSPPWSR
jgi:cytochrome c oxidase subunit 4